MLFRLVYRDTRTHRFLNTLEYGKIPVYNIHRPWWVTVSDINLKPDNQPNTWRFAYEQFWTGNVLKSLVFLFHSSYW